MPTLSCGFLLSFFSSLFCYVSSDSDGFILIYLGKIMDLPIFIATFLTMFDILYIFMIIKHIFCKKFFKIVLSTDRDLRIPPTLYMDVFVKIF